VLEADAVAVAGDRAVDDGGAGAIEADALRVVPTAWLISMSPARALPTRLERTIVTPVPALICTPVPALFVTVTPSRTMRAELSIQTACGAAARTVSPRRTMS
jgi:hypothetical protein